MKQKKTPYYVLCAVLLAGLAVLFLFPLYWIVTGSVKDKSEILVRAGQAVHWFPAAPTAENYRKLLKTAVSWALPGGAVKLPAAVKWLFNSVFISLMVIERVIRAYQRRNPGARTQISFSLSQLEPKELT